MAYLVSHNGRLWFQIRVPTALIGRYGRLIRTNLQTKDRAVAQPSALQMAGQWLTQFASERLAAGQSGAESPAPPPAKSKVVPPIPVFAPPAAPATLPNSPPTRASLPVWPQPVNLPPTAAHSEVPASREATASAPAPSPSTEGAGVKKPRKSPRILARDNLDAALDYWRSLHPDSREGTFREFRTVIDEFSERVRKPIAQLERRDIVAYRDFLLQKGAARGTVSKKIGLIGTLLQTLVDADYIQHNVARGMRIPKSKVPPIIRRSFTADELRRIFTSSVFAKNTRPYGAGGEAAVWIPLIALATGARLEEIAQLRTADITLDTIHGPLLNITDEGEEQHVKTLTSRRTLPLHPDLIKSGLMQYHAIIVKRGYPRLFPSLERDHDGRFGGNYGKWFMRYLRGKTGCGIIDGRVVFHSFRHTFKTLCREAGLPEEIHDALTGHQSSSVGRSYGHVPVSVLVDAVARIRFPITLPSIDY